MPSRLRPTASVAAEAILVGDPGRSLLLAQELLEQPKMSNHARGLWGYWGTTAAGRELTVQATGMGGPSAALVLDDLAELGVRRAIRIGTCTALDPALEPGELLVVTEARSWGGPEGRMGEAVRPDTALAAALEEHLGEGVRRGAVASMDRLHRGEGEASPAGAAAADMQTATLLARGEDLGVAIAAALIVAETVSGEHADDEALAVTAKLAGIAAAAVL